MARNLSTGAEHLDIESMPTSGHECRPDMLRHAFDQILGKVADTRPGPSRIQHRRTLQLKHGPRSSGLSMY